MVVIYLIKKKKINKYQVFARVQDIARADFQERHVFTTLIP
jgi:hypothetical protein